MRLSPPPARDMSNSLAILIPVYDDWRAAELLLQKLDAVLSEQSLHASVWLVDDGSPTTSAPELSAETLTALQEVHILRLRRNLGHQRAIAVGLSYLAKYVHPSAVVVMDADGEDDPRDVPRLYEELIKSGRRQIVFAERRRRAEGVTFRMFYWLYRLAHVTLTGVRVRVGNFSIVPGVLLQKMVVLSELWNHYAAAVMKSRLPYGMIPTHRCRRLYGTSRMNFVSLVAHGLSALSVFGETIGVRLLVATLGLMCLTMSVLGTIFLVKLATPWAIPGWASVISGLLVLLLLQSAGLLTTFTLVVLNSRSQQTFLPLRDSTYFVDDCRRIFPIVEKRRPMQQITKIGEELRHELPASLIHAGA